MVNGYEHPWILGFFLFHRERLWLKDYSCTPSLIRNFWDFIILMIYVSNNGTSMQT
jgi:hypothetical protein